MMHCGISGEVCEEPVLAKPSGVIYEKRVIMKYLETEGKDPTSGEDLTADDLVPIKQNKVIRPRPATATSIPGLIALFQNEWDSLMLETYTLKDHLAKTRQELAQALYQHDAACRVIARLVKERDSALRQVNALQAQFAQRVVDQAAMMDVEDGQNGQPADLNHPAGVSEEVLKAMNAKMEVLSKGRKKRPIPEGTPTAADIAKWTAKEEHTLHRSDKAGITSMDVLKADPHLIVTGGVDKEAIVYNRKAEKVVAHLSGHSKRVNTVTFHPDPSLNGLVITGSADRSVKVWRRGPDGSYGAPSATITPHQGEVTAVSIQATGSYFATASKDKSWAFLDLGSGQTLSVTADPAVVGGFECLQFHPDGILIGTGTAEKKVRMWDIKSQANVATFEEEHGAAVKAIAFSENGYFMASGGQDGVVKLWDLRKLKRLQSLDVGDPVNSLDFDFSGQYLAVGGKGVKVLLAKEWQEVANLQAHSDKVTAVKWAYPNSAFLASASLDRTVKLYH